MNWFYLFHMCNLLSVFFFLRSDKTRANVCLREFVLNRKNDYIIIGVHNIRTFTHDTI